MRNQINFYPAVFLCLFQVLEEFNESNSPTPKRILSLNPLARGPSASSTPARGRRGSIVEELRDVGLPSPLCGKGVQEHKLYTRLQVKFSTFGPI